MKKKTPLQTNKLLILLLFLTAGLSCKNITTREKQTNGFEAVHTQLVDSAATPETKALYYHLKNMKDTSVLFGQQAATIRGYGWLMEKGRCDLHEVTGSYPAVYGWDFAWLGKRKWDKRNKYKQFWINEIIKAYENGGVNTFSWHMHNPVTDNSCRDTIETVKQIIPGGEYHENYKVYLDSVADVIQQLKGQNGEAIPIIFRPFHEHTGSWFWWGQNFCNTEDFISMWRFTVEYLRDEKELHNILYAYSTDTVANREQYLERYPGDEYIDILGIDIYRDVESNHPEKYMNRIKLVAEIAEEKGKIAALTETGFSNPDIENFWTEFVLKPIKNDPVARKISYMLFWANYSGGAFFSIYPGHESEPDFLKLYEDSFTLFRDDLPNLYAVPEM